MPLTIRHNPLNGERVPLVLCDACDEPVTYDRDAIVEYEVDGDVRFLHKGKCAGIHSDAPWQEIDDFLSNLLHNATRAKGAQPKCEVA
jgi:hypothetical protein